MHLIIIGGGIGGHCLAAIMLKNGFKAVSTAVKYTHQAISENRLARMISRGWFRLCGRIPIVKKWTFGDTWIDKT